MANVDSILKDILVREGGYVDHPSDPGGATNMGVTLDTLQKWRGKPQTSEDVKLLSQEEALAIYRNEYVVKPGFAELPDPLRGLVVDCGVNHGTGTAAEWLQKALRVTADGIIGGTTRAALTIADPKELYRRVLASRARRFGRIITDKPSQAVFAAGWMARLAGFIEECP